MHTRTVQIRPAWMVYKWAKAGLQSDDDTEADRAPRAPSRCSPFRFAANLFRLESRARPPQVISILIKPSFRRYASHRFPFPTTETNKGERDAGTSLLLVIPGRKDCGACARCISPLRWYEETGGGWDSLCTTLELARFFKEPEKLMWGIFLGTADFVNCEI